MIQMTLKCTGKLSHRTNNNLVFLIFTCIIIVLPTARSCCSYSVFLYHTVGHISVVFMAQMNPIEKLSVIKAV